jgi:hypothetical protein
MTLKGEKRKEYDKKRYAEKKAKQEQEEPELSDLMKEYWSKTNQNKINGLYSSFVMLDNMNRLIEEECIARDKRRTQFIEKIKANEISEKQKAINEMFKT